MARCQWMCRSGQRASLLSKTVFALEELNAVRTTYTYFTMYETRDSQACFLKDCKILADEGIRYCVTKASEESFMEKIDLRYTLKKQRRPDLQKNGGAGQQPHYKLNIQISLECVMKQEEVGC